MRSKFLATSIGFGVMLFSSGCSLFYESTKPEPDAPRNVSCFLEYRPDPSRPGEPDIIFLAVASPYRLEEVYMNPVDMVFHGLVAPGRHLVEPVRIRGASCEPLWGKGHRLPQRLKPRSYMLCRRDGLEAVEIAVKTKWGLCAKEIPAGDATPRCLEHLRIKGEGLDRLSQEVCSSSGR